MIPYNAFSTKHRKRISETMPTIVPATGDSGARALGIRVTGNGCTFQNFAMCGFDVAFEVLGDDNQIKDIVIK
jgi:hypothetical protein